MKVQGLNDLVRTFHRINGNTATDRDSNGGGQPGSHGGQGQSRDSSQEDNGNHEEFRRLLELRQKIDQEISRFAQDEVAQKKGLQAKCDGEGPGLRVLLQDGQGNVIRRMSGDEFLQIDRKSTRLNSSH